MIEPRNIITITPKATYGVPLFGVTEAGLVQTSESEIRFCKGNKADPTAFRQEGFFTETLLAACKTYLEENNVGELASRETSMAITKLDEALMWLGKRAEDRRLRGVQGTYQK